MLKVVAVRQTLEDTKLVKDIYEIEELFKDIIRRIKKYNELDEIDFRFINLTLGRTKADLTKVDTLLKIISGGENNGQAN